MPSLKDYRAKRHFSKTAEPEGAAPRAHTKSPLLYVVQMHRARRLHYDFRLELDGVLLSWAAPKGPSLDPAERRLAVRTEDHPLEYGSFEGVIPKGEYGAGAVMLWDRGSWTPRGDAREGLAKGHLKFDLDGRRLHGGFALTRLPPRGREKHENWLLIKERDAFADRAADPVEEWTRSVATGRDLDEIGAGKKAKRKSAAPLPGFVAPQLATPAEEPPSGPNWLHEIKFDGYRVLAALSGGRARLYTRSGLDWTEKFGALGASIARLGAGAALLDGEVVALDENGRSDFGRLQEALKKGGETLRYYVFDLLEHDGEDLRALPLIERKTRLAALLRGAPPDILYSDHLTGDAQKIFAESCRMGVEGVVSKRADKPYVPRRSRSWIKVKCGARDEFVIGGWRPSSARDRPFASLLIGEFEDGALHYRGRVGAGFGGPGFAELARMLRRLARKSSPFAGAPKTIASRAKWVEPKIVAEISYTERTREGVLRHPVFIATREDKPARQVETPSPAARRAAQKLTHPEKLLFPGAGVTKADLAAYWRTVAPLALPHIAGRPLSLLRCPEGRQKACFFQRHRTQGMPAAILPAPLADSKGALEDFLKIEQAEGLEAAAQIGALELHIWGAQAGGVEHPDRLVFDLDPGEGEPFASVKRAAKDFRDLLEAAGLKSFALLTGGKGVHVVAPLAPALTWDRVKAFTRGVAQRLARDDPGRFTSIMSKARRKGKIYIDWRRNERGASAVAPFSPRSKERAPVATPVGWDELARIDRADAYTIATLPRRLASLKGRDPWAGYFDLEQHITNAALRMFAP